MRETEEKKIQSIIERKYKKDEQLLDLTNQNQNWCDILSIRDWSMLKTIVLSINAKLLRRLYDKNCQFQMAMFSQKIGGNKLTVQGVRYLRQKQWDKLESINLSCNNIEDQGISLLLQKFYGQLTFLSIVSSGLTKKGMQLFISSRLINLKQLYLNKNYIHNLGIKLLVKSDLPELKRLEIGQCGIGGSGLKHLTKGKWPNLTFLFLGYYQDKNSNKMGLDSWETFHHHYWKQIKQIYASQLGLICWIQCILISKPRIEYYGNILIQNKYLHKTVNKILRGT